MSAADEMCYGVDEDTEENKIQLKRWKPLKDFVSFMANVLEDLSLRPLMILYSFVSDNLEEAIRYLNRECFQELSRTKSFYNMYFSSICAKERLVLENRVEILLSQGSHFKHYMNCLKSEKAKRIYTLKPIDARRLCEKILREVEFECNLHRKAPFLYAYKEKLLTSIEQNQITIVSADACYSPSEAIPFFLHQAYPNDVILSCEPNTDTAVLLTEKCRTFENSDLTDLVGCEVDGRVEKKANDTKIIFTSIFELYRKGTVSHYFSNCKLVVMHCDLARSFETDILLEQIRDSLTENNALKIILLLSPLDDSSKFVSYFSSFTVHTLVFPDITFPVQTVWLTEPVSIGEFNPIAIIDTALAIHALNERGNVLVVLPEHCSVTMWLSQRFAEWAYYDVVCIPLPGYPSEQTMLDFFEPNENPLKRKFYLTTMSLAAFFYFPDVSYIIDSGIHVDATASHLNLITTGRPHNLISKQKAKQLKSLAGHCKKGICYRLYSKQDYLNKMAEKEMPEVLYKNPHEIVARMCEHSSREVMTMDFVQNLCEKKKKEILMMLRKANAMKGSQLTAMGEQMVKLPFLPSYSKLIVLGIQQDFGYEAIVLVAFLLLNKSVFIDHAGNKDMEKLVKLSKLRYELYDSDLFTFLNIFQEFCSSKVYNASWCNNQGLDFSVLLSVKKNVTRINDYVHRTLKKDIYPKLRLKEESDWFALRELLLNCFADNLCVYTGHYSCGYHLLRANCLTSLDPSSVLQKHNLPEFVIFGDFKNASERIISGVTFIPRELVLSAMETHLSMFKERQLVGPKLEPIVVENIGIALMKRTFIGEDGERLLELKNQIKRATNCDLIVIEPSVENCNVTLYVPAVSINVVERMIHKILKTELNSLLNRREESIVELRRGEFSLPIRFIWGKGGVTSWLGCNNYEAKQPTLSESKSYLSLLHSHASERECIKLKFFRRMCKGYGYVSFKSENFIVARRLALSTIEINGKEAKIEAQHETNQLCISRLPNCITSRGLKDAVEAALEKLFSDTIEVKSATVAYQEPYETTDKERDVLKGKILKNYCRLFPTCDISVAVPKPQNTAFYMEAFITMNKLDLFAKGHAQLLNGVLRIDDLPVEAETHFSSVITCSKTMCEYFKKEMGRFEPSVVDTNRSYHGLVTLNLFFKNVVEQFNSQSIIRDLVGGREVTRSCHKKLHKLFTHEGHSWLRALEQQIDIHIVDNYESTVLQLYGTPAKCDIATEQIIKYLDNPEKEIVKKVHFSNGNSLELVLKTVRKIYGTDLKSFIENFMLSSANIDFHEANIVIQGDRQNIENALMELKRICSTILPDVQNEVLTSLEVCCVCQTPPMQPSIRLEHCTHLYCMECLEGLITNANLPIVCCAEDCGKELLSSDILMGLDYEKTEIENLLHFSMKDFISKNSHYLSYCPSPDCSMYLDERWADDAKCMWTCPLCRDVICINCHDLYHHGFTCEMYQEMKRGPDFHVKIWMDEKTSERKQCPRCNTGIEKTFGCNHMHCSSCKAHFCWLCLLLFPDSDSVYRHQPNCPHNLESIQPIKSVKP